MPVTIERFACSTGLRPPSSPIAHGPRPCGQFGPMVSHWRRPAPCDRPRSHRHIEGQVNRNASPSSESPGSSLRRRPQLAACCRRGVLRVGARAGPARTAARAVPAVLAEQGRPGLRGVRRLQSGRAAGTGLTGTRVALWFPRCRKSPWFWLSPTPEIASFEAARRRVGRELSVVGWWRGTCG